MKQIFLILSFFLASFLASSQPGSAGIIQITVVDAAGNPIRNASLTLKKAGNTTFSANDGKATFKVSSQDTLVISYVGFLTVQRLVYPNNGDIKIQLQEAKHELGEVIVQTGYQAIRKERATGSFVHISDSLFNQQTGTNILGRLEAIANGFSVDRKTLGGGNRNMVRGLSTLIGPRDPLVIVDNFPYPGNLDNLNPNDVESITILKDAAAASIWGTKAGNGVIVITMKKGKFNQKTMVASNANVMFGSKPDLFYLPYMSSSDLVDVETFLYSKGYYTNLVNSANKTPLSPVVELLIRKANGSLGPMAADSAINSYRDHDVRSDFLDQLYQRSVNQQYALNASGGSSKATWLLSGGMDRNSSSLKSVFERINVRSENRFRFTEKFQGTASSAFTDSRSLTGAPAYSEVTSAVGGIPQYTRFSDANGNPLPVIKNYRQAYIDTAGGGKLLDWNYYPLTDYPHNNGTVKIQDITARLGLEYEIVKGLSASVRYQYENQRTSEKLVQDAESYYTRNLVNLYSQLNRTTGTVTYRIPTGGILDLAERTLVSHNLRAQLDFNKQWTNHRIAAIAGFETRGNDARFNGYRTYGYDPERLTYGTVDLTTAYPTYVQGSTAFIPAGTGGIGHAVERYVSTYANASETYLGRYILTVSARRDASNLFGVATKNKWTPLWSVGGAWDISKENFYGSSWLPYLKLRTTYGYSGNADPGRTGVTTISYISSSPYTLTQYASVSNFYNPELRWEQIAMLNVGLDFSTRGNRLSGSLEYYHKKGTDLFGTSPIDITSGLNVETLLRNVASMVGNGVDVELHSRNIDGAFKWMSNLNFSYYRDRVTEYYLASKLGSRFINGAVNIAGVVGKPVYSVFAYKWAGLDPLTGDPQGYLNGAISKNYASITGSGTTVDDLVYAGPAFPTVFGSLGNTFSYRHIGLTVQLLYKFGYWFQRPSINYTSLFASFSGNSDYAKRWQKPGDETTTNVPSLTYPASSSRDAFYTSSEVLLEKGDHVRLQYITLSYDFSLGRKTAIPFSKMQFYINANNLGIVWRATKSGLDPDYRNGVVPVPKNITVGLRTTF